MKRPVWLFSMDSEQFHAPPTTTAALLAYYRSYGETSPDTEVDLVHFRDFAAIEQWQSGGYARLLAEAQHALDAGLQPIAGFSFYTWNAAEFLSLVAQLKSDIPDILVIVGGPHVQQAEDYLGHDPIDVIVLGEGEETFTELLDASNRDAWLDINGLAFLQDSAVLKTVDRGRQKNLDEYPSPLDVIQLSDEQGQPLYDSISYETSRGCPFKCAFCEWGTGAIGSKMYQWSMDRLRRDWNKIADAGIKDLWLADSNFGALKQDREKAELIVELKQRTGLPVSFATSWSKKHSQQVQDIALLLHRHDLLPHYQLALQTLTPEALRLSNRQNMSSNQYEPIAKRMSEQGVPIAAELIWGLPGDNLPDFETNLDRLLATFPNINIFGYTLLPGTEFYRRRDEYHIEAVPVAGYGKAKGEYVVGCHSFDRDQGEEGYFLITAHILLIHGYMMPLTTRLLALRGEVPVSRLLRQMLRALLQEFAVSAGIDSTDRMQVYEQRNDLYLSALAEPERCFAAMESCLALWLEEHGASASHSQHALQLLRLDALLCPRVGNRTLVHASMPFDAQATHRALSAMELPSEASFAHTDQSLQVQHPGGVGEILHDADGGSWLRGEILEQDAVPLLASA